MQRFRSRVSDILSHQGRSDRWFYTNMGVSESLHYCVERGTRNASAEYRARAALLLGVPEAILFLPIESSDVGEMAPAVGEPEKVRVA
jgi:hypothetical protein